jgi:hypothetical protein
MTYLLEFQPMFKTPASKKYVSSDIAFPKNWFKELQELAGLYGASVVLLPEVTWIAGHYNKESKTCYINAPYEDCELFPTDYVVQTFCHELAHHIQHHVLGAKEKTTLSEKLAFEQEACDIGFELARHHFPDFYMPKQTYLDFFATKENLREFGVHHGCDRADIEEVVSQFEPITKTLDLLEQEVKVTYDHFQELAK